MVNARETPLQELRAKLTVDDRAVTLQQLAAATGFSASRLSSAERGVSAAGPNLVRALARFYRLPLERMQEVCDATHRSKKRKS